MADTIQIDRAVVKPSIAEMELWLKESMPGNAEWSASTFAKLAYQAGYRAALQSQAAGRTTLSEGVEFGEFEKARTQLQVNASDIALLREEIASLRNAQAVAEPVAPGLVFYADDDVIEMFRDGGGGSMRVVTAKGGGSNTPLYTTPPDTQAVLHRALVALQDIGTLTTYCSEPSSIWKRFYASSTGGDYVDLREFRERTKSVIAEIEAMGVKA